jgi:hypothetical protein
MPETVYLNNSGVLDSFNYTFVAPVCRGYQNTTLVITVLDANGVELNQDAIAFSDC